MSETVMVMMGERQCCVRTQGAEQIKGPCNCLHKVPGYGKVASNGRQK